MRCILCSRVVGYRTQRTQRTQRTPEQKTTERNGTGADGKTWENVQG